MFVFFNPDECDADDVEDAIRKRLIKPDFTLDRSRGYGDDDRDIAVSVGPLSHDDVIFLVGLLCTVDSMSITISEHDDLGVYF